MVIKDDFTELVSGASTAPHVSEQQMSPLSLP